MDGKAQRRLQDLAELELRTQAQHQPGHVARQLARQLDAAAHQQQVDDREVETLAPHGQQGLRPRARHPDALPGAAQQERQGSAVGRVAIDNEHRSDHHVPY